MGDCCGRVHQQLCYMLCAGVWQQQWSRLRTMPVTWVSCSWSWTSGNARGWMIERSPCGPRTSSWLVSFEREDQQLFVCLFVYLVMVSLCPNSGIAANWFIVAIQWEKNNFMSLWHPGVALSNEWLRLSNFTWWKPHQSRSLTPSTSNCLQPASSKSLRVVCVCVCVLLHKGVFLRGPCVLGC